MDKWTPALPRARDGTTAMERTRSDIGLVVHRNGLNDQLLDLEILELDLPEDAGMVQNEGLDEAVATLGPQDLNLVHPHSLFACRPEKAHRILADSDPEIQQVRILRCLGTEGQHADPAPAAADDVHGGYFDIEPVLGSEIDHGDAGGLHVLDDQFLDVHLPHDQRADGDAAARARKGIVPAGNFESRLAGRVDELNLCHNHLLDGLVRGELDLERAAASRRSIDD